MNAFATLDEGSGGGMAFAPYILPGAWALGEGLDLTAMPMTPRAVVFRRECATAGGVWSSFLEAVAAMVGWEWEFRQNHASKRGTGGSPGSGNPGDSPSSSSRSSSCDMGSLEVGSLSDDSDESEDLEVGGSRLSDRGGSCK